MNIQINRVRKGERVYKYCRLVKSYRRADGKPALKVLANQGELPPLLVENLKLAIRAAKAGKVVVEVED